MTGRPVRRVPPREMPRLQPPGGLPVEVPPFVLLLDANVVLPSLHRQFARPDKPEPALFELVWARNVRVIMSARDIEQRPGGLDRLEEKIRDKFPGHAPEMMAFWRERVKPHVQFLDPAGFEDTPGSALVRTPEWDEDDADLPLIGHIVGAHGFLSYDREAFGDQFPVLVVTGQDGMILSAFRDAQRAKEAGQTLMLGPVYVARGASMLTQATAKRLNLPVGVVVGGALLLIIGLMAALPKARRAAGELGLAFVDAAAGTVPEPAVQAQMEEAQGRVRVVWEVSVDERVRAARHLAATHQPLTASELCRALHLGVKASELSGRLEQHPGMFERVGRRWSVRLSNVERG